MPSRNVSGQHGASAVFYGFEAGATFEATPGRQWGFPSWEEASADIVAGGKRVEEGTLRAAFQVDLCQNELRCGSRRFIGGSVLS